MIWLLVFIAVCVILQFIPSADTRDKMRLEELRDKRKFGLMVDSSQPHSGAASKNLSSSSAPFPRPASPQYLRGEYPRPACWHDPNGVLETCPQCPEPRLGRVYESCR